MSDPFLFIHGHGAVSSAGTDAGALYRACVEGRNIPTVALERALGGTTLAYPHRPVDTEALRASLPKHPRLRRASNATRFAMTAAHQAIGAERIGKIRSRELRVGVIVSLLNGCVNFTNRFFGEVLEDPSLASPMLFPETVFNAPASHVAAYLDCDGPVYTLIGDAAAWFSAIPVAEEWISSGQVDGCLVVCAEEIDWLTLEGLGLYSRELVATEGAAAVYLEANPSDLAIGNLHGPYGYTSAPERRAALRDAWQAVRENADGLLIDGLTGIASVDCDEVAATRDWQGPRLSPAKVLGEGMGIRCGLQTIAAIEALRAGQDSATVLAGGGNQHAFAARFITTRP